MTIKTKFICQNPKIIQSKYNFIEHSTKQEKKFPLSFHLPHYLNILTLKYIQSRRLYYKKKNQ